MNSRMPRAALAMERICAEATDPDELLEAVAEEMHRSVPSDGALWLGVDPATMLATAPGRATGIDEGTCSSFWRREFHVADALLYRDLARQPVPVDTLRYATDDHPARSARYREFLSPLGYDDELRAVLRVGDKPWGLLGLYREKGRAAFDADDVALVDAIGPSVGRALRRFAGGRSRWDSMPGSPGLLLFDPDDRLLSANAEARRWMDELHTFGGLTVDTTGGVGWVQALVDGQVADIAAPPALCALVARTRAVAAGVEPGPARLRLRGRNERWLVLHGSCLGGSPGVEPTVAVVIEPAKSAEIAPIVIESYALSTREREVVRGISRGLSTNELAAELFLSVHTVRDYIKAVFEKVGVASRGELIAKLFAEHYVDALHATFVHAD